MARLLAKRSQQAGCFPRAREHLSGVRRWTAEQYIASTAMSNARHAH